MEFSRSLSTPQLVAAAFGTVSIGYGLRAILTPSGFARAFGLPQAAAAPRNPFVVATGGRTAAMGISIVSLALLDNVQGSGVILMSCVVSGIIDTFNTYFSGDEGAFLQHAIGTMVLGGLGWYLTASTK